ncbi:hypothetical protein QF015_002868 [Paenarthrobacter sp. TE4293]|uniref:hypothetical protein n=1 Tax=Paenarthrobacter sp. TE4293 TaxID=3381695 RepID=UPI003D2038ED
MDAIPDRSGQPGAGGHEPEYEVIGGGFVDDQPRVTSFSRGSEPTPAAVVTTALELAWQDARNSLSSWWFWLGCSSALGLAWGMAAAMFAWMQSLGWFDSAVSSAMYVFMAGFLALAAAVAGIVWGFRHAQSSILVRFLAATIRGVAFAVPSCVVLLMVGLSTGGPPALAGAAAVVIVLEVGLFGLMGGGARACFASTLPAGVLAAVVTMFLCFGNGAFTLLLLPGTTETGGASVPVNVERDDAGRITAYECVGTLHAVEVAHTERVAWLAASNPALLLGSVGAEFVPPDHDLGWVLAGLQFASDGPSREVPCLGGESSDGLAPPVPVALTGFAVQAGFAAVLTASARWRTARRVGAP